MLHSGILVDVPKHSILISNFWQAISQDAHAPVNTLNSRAATYIKLGNLQAGLRDARQMILQEKANITVHFPRTVILELKADCARATFVQVKFCSSKVIRKWL